MKAGTGFTRFFGPVFWIVACVVLSPNIGAAGIVGMPVTTLTVSEYGSKDLSLITRVHAARVFVDYEHWGFFRIGLLPMLVAEDVQIKIQSAEDLANALADLKSWHHPASGYRQLELRNVEITFSAENQPRLRAAVARVGPDGVVKLSAVILRDAVGRQLSIPKATLQISGPSAGRFCWNDGGHQKTLLILQTPPEKTP